MEKIIFKFKSLHSEFERIDKAVCEHLGIDDTVVGESVRRDKLDALSIKLFCYICARFMEDYWCGEPPTYSQIANYTKKERDHVNYCLREIEGLVRSRAKIDELAENIVSSLNKTEILDAVDKYKITGISKVFTSIRQLSEYTSLEYVDVEEAIKSGTITFIVTKDMEEDLEQGFSKFISKKCCLPIEKQ